MEKFVTGMGQKIIVHDRTEFCDIFGCSVHNPTDSRWPTHWRDDRGLMERTCPHGVGHPDRDHIAFVRRTKGDERADAEAVHGCDGCCCRPEVP